jgi:hypothetical protein
VRRASDVLDANREAQGPTRLATMIERHHQPPTSKPRDPLTTMDPDQMRHPTRALSSSGAPVMPSAPPETPGNQQRGTHHPYPPHAPTTPRSRHRSHATAATTTRRSPSSGPRLHALTGRRGRPFAVLGGRWRGSVAHRYGPDQRAHSPDREDPRVAADRAGFAPGPDGPFDANSGSRRLGLGQTRWIVSRREPAGRSLKSGWWWVSGLVRRRRHREVLVRLRDR